jgi:hypothetical protein
MIETQKFKIFNLIILLLVLSTMFEMTKRHYHSQIIKNLLHVTFGWHENSGIDIIFRIKIITVQLNVNLLFRNSENSCYSAIPMRK